MPASLPRQLRSLVGRRHVLSRPAATKPYRTGYRAGGGPCLCVVRPGTLLEFWQVLKACVAADAGIIIQAANTGLTGGSTPDGDYDRPLVIISTLRMRRIHLLKGGEQVLCHAGATLHSLEQLLAPLGREPHSVIGSSCIGASVVGGICNNSGGALVRRGPAYTELALYGRLGEDGALTLVNHLGLNLGDNPEVVLSRLDNPDLDLTKLICADGRASDLDYASDVRDVDADTPARFNADPKRLFEASGSAGKVAVLAVRLDTFPSEASTQTFYVGTNDPAELSVLRRTMLTEAPLPIAAEYLHAEAFDLADRYGRGMFQAIRTFGTDRLPLLARLQSRFNTFAERLPGHPASLGERLLQRLSRLMGDHLPPRVRAFRERFSHHLLLKVRSEDEKVTLRALETMGSATSDFFRCTADEAERAFLHRFVMAGAAIRYRDVHRDKTEDVLSLDVALRRNDREWFETLAPEIEADILVKIYYGHFFCHVLHQDYVLRKGSDLTAIKEAMLRRLDERGAEYPAEHNVGHQYFAKPALERHYRMLDPLNRFNPGIGRLSRSHRWCDRTVHDD